MSGARVSPVKLGLIALGVLVAGWLVFGFVKAKLDERSVTVTAVFEDTGELSKGTLVRIGGIDVGKVKSVDLDRGGRTATVEMQLTYTPGEETHAVPLYSDLNAAIRFKTLLGGPNVVVDLDRGTPGAGRYDGEPIPVARTSTQVELDDITAVIQDDPQRGLESLLDELPRGLRDPEAPAAALGELAEAAPVGTRAVRALRGEQDGDLRALIRNAAAVVQAVDGPDRPVGGLVSSGATTVQATARSEAAIDHMLELGAPVQRRAVATLRQLDGTLGRADPVVDLLLPTADDVGPTADRLQRTLRLADPLLADAEPLLRALRPAVSDLAIAGRQGVPLLDALEPTLTRVDGQVLPNLAEVDPVSKRPTFQMIGPTLAGLGGIAAGFDAEANFGRLGGGGGERVVSDSLPCQTFFTDPETEEAIRCENAFDVFQGLITGGKPRIGR